MDDKLKGTTTIETVTYVTVNESLLIASYVLRTYGYIIIGTTLAILNVPVFLLVFLSKLFRNSYSVLSIVFLNNGLTGIFAALLGMKRLFSAAGHKTVEHHSCLINVAALLVAMTTLNAWSLLMNSTDRLFVVAFPLFYYIHSEIISHILIAIQYIATVIIMICSIAITFSETARNISDMCLPQQIFESHIYGLILAISSTVALLSIALMVIVVIILKKNFGENSDNNFLYNRKLVGFLKRQRQYTNTSLLSCFITFFLFVVPSIIQYVYMSEVNNATIQFIVMCSVYLCFLNSYNMVLTFLYRQQDIRRVAFRYFTRDKTRNQIGPSNVIATVPVYK